MKNIKEFDFSRARRVTTREVEEGRRAIEAKLGIKRPLRGRPPKKAVDKYCPIYIRLHPRAYRWAQEKPTVAMWAIKPLLTKPSWN